MGSHAAKIVSLALLLVLASCDEEDQQPQGGGPGSSSPALSSVEQTPVDGGGFGTPSDTSGFGSPSFDVSAVAKVDLDGDPNAQGQDVHWQPQTTGGVNSAQAAFVVMSRDQMANANAAIGDWAVVTNNQTGATTWARVEDVGPTDGTGEISEAAASAVGIQTTVVQTRDGPETVTVGNPSVTVKVYGGSAGVPGSVSNLPPASIP
jgi:hypothetical protein